jgi:hypothetical protein
LTKGGRMRQVKLPLLMCFLPLIVMCTCFLSPSPFSLLSSLLQAGSLGENKIRKLQKFSIIKVSNL